MKRILIFLLAALILAGGGYAWMVRNADQSAREPVFHGNVDIREVRLGFRVQGRVLEVLKEEGDPVRAGEILARIDPEPYDYAVQRLQAQLEARTARLQELENGARPEEIERSRKNLAAAQAVLENAELIHERQKELVATKTVPRQDYDTARADWLNAEAQRDAAQSALDLLLAGARQEQIDQAGAEVQTARASLEEALIRLQDTELRAAEPGVVLTRVVEPGSMVQAGSPALTISLDHPVRVRAYVPEPRLGLVFPGRKVLVFTDSRSDPYHGHVGDVSPRAEFTPKSVETEDLRTSLVYRFRAVVDDPDQGLRQGMPVTVRLAPEE